MIGLNRILVLVFAASFVLLLSAILAVFDSPHAIAFGSLGLPPERALILFSVTTVIIGACLAWRGARSRDGDAGQGR